MDKMIVVEHLLSDEFSVECFIRDIKGTIPQQSKELSARLLEEFVGKTEAPTLAHANAKKNPKREIKFCSERIKFLKQELEKLIKGDSDLSVNALQTIQSRLIHIFGRLQRISSSETVRTNSKALSDSCNLLLSSINDLLGNRNIDSNSIFRIPDLDVEEYPESESTEIENVDLPINTNSQINNVQNFSSAKLKKTQSSQPTSTDINFPSTSQGLQHENELTKMILKLSEQIKSLEAQSVSKIDKPNTYHKRKSKDHSKNLLILSSSSESLSTKSAKNMYTTDSDSEDGNSTELMFGKLNCQFYFDGSASSMPVDDFLYRVERLGKIHQIAKSKLVDEISFLLKDTAATWYWRYLKKTKCNDWFRLKKDFRAYFDDRSDENIIRYIENRKQRTRESFADYYKDIRSKILNLSTDYEDNDLMRILYKNMRPGLACLFPPRSFKSIREMVLECTKLEESWNKHNFIPELLCQKRVVNELDNTDSYNTDLNGCHPNVDAMFNQHNNNKFDSVPKQLLCWNCLGSHRYRDCPDPLKSLSCFGCGKSGPLKPYCVDCILENLAGSTGKNGVPMYSKKSSKTPVNQINEEYPNPKI